MGGWVHRLSEIDPVNRTATCEHCGPVRIHRRGIAGRSETGNWRCVAVSPSGSASTRVYREHKGDVCERCDFEPEDPCQLDVHHVDGDSSNNDVDNLQTLCANCHRLVTKLEEQGFYTQK